MAFAYEHKAFEQLPEYMQRAITDEIALAVDEEFERMEKRIKARKSEIVAGVILDVKKRMDVTTATDRMVITIDTSVSSK